MVPRVSVGQQSDSQALGLVLHPILPCSLSGCRVWVICSFHHYRLASSLAAVGHLSTAHLQRTGSFRSLLVQVCLFKHSLTLLLFLALKPSFTKCVTHRFAVVFPNPRSDREKNKKLTIFLKTSKGHLSH